MFDNIGSKIKTVAVVSCVANAILFFGIGIFLMVDVGFVYGLLAWIVGGLASWVGSFFTYGIGQQIEDTQAIRQMLEMTHNPRWQRNVFPVTDTVLQAKPAKLQVEKSVPQEKEPMKHQWRCPRCGNMVEGDACPHCSPETSEMIPEDHWQCKACGELIPNFIPYCHCGYKKP